MNLRCGNFLTSSKNISGFFFLSRRARKQTVAAVALHILSETATSVGRNGLYPNLLGITIWPRRFLKARPMISSHRPV